MKILVIGSGGREHALAWKLKQSTKVEKVFVAPGNAGTAMEPGVLNIAIPATNTEELINFAKKEQIDLTVVGPETPLVAGMVDRFEEAGLRCFGPSKRAAQLEGSKSFAKVFLSRHGIPTARYAVFTELSSALAYVRQQGTPIVIKADGLAAGKGVVVAITLQEAENALQEMLSAQTLGQAGERVVVEEFLPGEEASFIAICDGKYALPFATSQDHKRRDDNDQGPNTGGMGAYSPAPVVTSAIEMRIMETIIRPTLAGMAAEGMPFTGFLYAGLMITPQGEPKVIEFNVRLGDPETQPLLMRLQSGLVELIEAALDGKLHQQTIQWDKRPALGVVLAAHGYPGTVRLGDKIQGLYNEADSDIKIFHAGTKMEKGKIISCGGRVLTVCALAETLYKAKECAYAELKKIKLAEGFYRHDIGRRALNRYC